MFGHPESSESHYPTLGCRPVTVAGTQIGEELSDNPLIKDMEFTHPPTPSFRVGSNENLGWLV